MAGIVCEEVACHQRCYTTCRIYNYNYMYDDRYLVAICAIPILHQGVTQVKNLTFQPTELYTVVNHGSIVPGVKCKHVVMKRFWGFKFREVQLNLVM